MKKSVKFTLKLDSSGAEELEIPAVWEICTKCDGEGCSISCDGKGKVLVPMIKGVQEFLGEVEHQLDA